MKSINLSVEHLALKELVTLASMDCQSESTNTLSEFWSQVNNALREFTGDQGYIFDPEGFVTDEHGGNRESIRRMLKPGAVGQSKVM
ncbi:hypothetical protein OS493_007005 [Desmophyllum pertusum]|uniref:Uncharacterized protein n=1 Tax=Desmophyllum pertusum TaxID=174260 RepID=A0A9X0CYW6_9CNID|nr:hypothetical protein OS493_007005 [Desmophyllum pertusum]